MFRKIPNKLSSEPHFDSCPGKQQPARTCILPDGSPTEETQHLSASSFRAVLVLPGSHWNKQQWDPQPWGWHSSSVFPAGQDTAKSNLCIAMVIPTCPVLWIERRKLVKSQLQIREHWPFCWLAKSFLSPPTCTELPADTQEDKDAPAVEVCKFFSRQGMLALCCQMWLQAQTRLIHSCCWATNSPLRHPLGTHGPTLHSQILQQIALTNLLLTP